MKRGATSPLQIKIDLAGNTISTVKFIFKQERTENAKVYVTKSYPSSSVIYDSVNKIFTLLFTEAETRSFIGDIKAYLDTKIVKTDGTIPETPIVELFINDTLFSEGD